MEELSRRVEELSRRVELLNIRAEEQQCMPRENSQRRLVEEGLGCRLRE